MSKLTGLGGGENGGNEKYKDNRTGEEMTRRQAVGKVKQGNYPGSHVLNVNGKEYVRDNPDQSKADNVNKRKR